MLKKHNWNSTGGIEFEPYQTYAISGDGSMYRCDEVIQDARDFSTDFVSVNPADIDGSISADEWKSGYTNYSDNFDYYVPISEPRKIPTREYGEVYSIPASPHRYSLGPPVKLTKSSRCRECCYRNRLLIAILTAVIVVVIILITVALAVTLAPRGGSSDTGSFVTVSTKAPFPKNYSCNPTVACGCSTQSAILTRIVGGEAAASQTWGWAVQLRIQNWFCGGSIIARSWILTAAHCVQGVAPSQIIVYAGSTMRLVGTQIRNVSTILMHPYFSPLTYINDIALLNLTTPFNMSDPNLSTICFPSVSSMPSPSYEYPPVDTTVTAIGWGRLTENGFTSLTLQQVTLKTISRLSPFCYPVILDSSIQLCAGAPGKDTCQGDSGGPLMAFTSSNQWVIVGITSGGIGCARSMYFGSYTRISAFQAWISMYIGGQFINPNSSTFSS